MKDTRDGWHQVTFRIPDEMHKRLQAAMALENSTLSLGEPLNMNRTLRDMCADYIKRWESIAASAEAQHAGKVLANGRKAARRG
jgi:hypothetical protein